MIAVLLILIPFVFGIVSFFVRHNVARRILIVACAGFHLGLSCIAWFWNLREFFSGWIALDDMGMVFLTTMSILFFGSAIYGVRYLSDENSPLQKENKEQGFFSQEAIFSGCLLLFLSTMTIVVSTQQLAILWVGIEATTLASAPLIYFHRTRRSLEAMWKYLLICSVGIAIALLGIFFMAAANDNQGGLLLSGLLENAKELNIAWLKAAFLLLFVGYGTKIGLAPLHTWLPDAHSEAPSVVSALLSGALLNCAFLGILRIYQVCVAAGLREFCQEIFVFFGLLSIVFAAVFILGQTDYKRMLAYSSVEHMGIITLGFGLGGTAIFGAMINMLGHSLTKAGLFFVAGNILSYFRTKKIDDVSGLMSAKTRASGALWITGFLLITGMPPSAIFLGKLMILKEVLFQGRYWTGVFFLSALALIFIGMTRIFVSMTQGCPIQGNARKGFGEKISFLRHIIPMIFFIFVIGIGFYFPECLTRAIEEIAKALGE
ncbi:MAG: proton-conducting transporter membrane subunit [Chlamydiota bacterium]|nr:proton-conducting transporter membrane subunit [Chlamydiota bacterium]